MRKIFSCTVAMLALTLCVVGLAACDSSKDHVHTLVQHDEVAPTCTASGTKLYWECTDCGELFGDKDAANAMEPASIAIPAAGHTLGEWIEDAPATGGEHGVKAHYNCAVCEKNFAQDGITELVDLTLHGLTLVEGTPAACEEDGEIEHYTCTVCEKNFADAAGETELEDLKIPAAGHKDEVLEGYDATCTEAGLTEGKWCPVCETVFIEQEDIDPLGHTEEVVKGYDATCTEAGKTDGTKCSVCGITLAEQEDIDPLGHDLEDVTGKAATCTEPGYTEYKACSRCDHTEGKEELNAIGHAYGEEWAADEDTHWHVCANGCGIKGDEQGHTESEWITDKQPSCTEEGHKYIECTECHEKLSEETIGKPDHDFSVLMHSEEEHWYKCSTCDETDGREPHYGGKATTTDKATCELCEEPYGNPLTVSDYEGGKALFEEDVAHLSGSGSLNQIDAASNGYDLEGLNVGSVITYVIQSTYEGAVKLSVAVAGGSDFYWWDEWTMGWNGTLENAFTVYIDGTLIDSYDVGPMSWPGFTEILLGSWEFNNGAQYKIEIVVNGELNFDHLKIAPTIDGADYDGKEALILEAEEAELVGGTPGSHGSDKYVGGLATGNTITFKFYSDVDEKVQLTLRLANGGADITGSLRVYVNDEELCLMNAPGTNDNGWWNFREVAFETYELQAGEMYTIKFEVVDAGGRVNVDYLKISTWKEGEPPVVDPEPPVEEELPNYDGSAALILQAESATLSGCRAEGNFVGGMTVGGTLTFKFTSSVAGEVELYISAATANSGIGFSVVMNDEDLPFVTIYTGGWTNFADHLVIKLELEADKTYVVVFTAGEGTANALNVDYFKVAPIRDLNYSEGKTLTFGAADVDPQNGCNRQAHSAGHEGNIVGDINQAGRGVLLTLNSNDATTAHLSVFTDGDNNANVSFEIWVNGEYVGTCSYTAGGWVNFAERDAGNISLHEGENTIEIRLAEGSAGMNFSHLTLSPAN